MFDGIWNIISKIKPEPCLHFSKTEDMINTQKTSSWSLLDFKLGFPATIHYDYYKLAYPQDSYHLDLTLSIKFSDKMFFYICGIVTWRDESRLEFSDVEYGLREADTIKHYRGWGSWETDKKYFNQLKGNSEDVIRYIYFACYKAAEKYKKEKERANRENENSF